MNSASTLRSAPLTALSLAALYALFATLWIFASDSLLSSLGLDAETVEQLQLYKGLLFVTITALMLYLLLRGTPRSVSMDDTVQMQQAWERIPLRNFALVLVLLAAAIGVSGFLYFEHMRESSRREARTDLATVNEIKIQQIRDWIEERRMDAAMLAGDPTLAAAAAAWMARGAPRDAARHALSERLSAARRAYRYPAIFLLDKSGHAMLGNGTGAALDPGEIATAREAVRTQQVTLQDLYCECRESDQAPSMGIHAPLFSGGGALRKAVGVVYIRIDPWTALYPITQSRHLRSETHESVLLRRDGEAVLFLSPLRYRPGPVLSFRLPGNDFGTIAARALRGDDGLIEGRDYRGVAALGVGDRIPGTPWILATKMDADEIYGQAGHSALRIVTLAVVLVAVIGFTIGLWWRQQHARHLATRFRAELERKALVRHFDYLVKYANDIILLADADDRIVEVNDRACAAYGYSRAQLLGMRMSDLCSCVPDENGDSGAECPPTIQSSDKVFEARHRRSNGETFPAEISARVIAIDGHTYAQSVIRDISERVSAEEALRASEVRFRSLIENTSDIVFVVDGEGTVRYASPSVDRVLGFPPAQVVGINAFDFVHADDAERVRAEFAGFIATPGALIRTELRARDSRRKWHLLEVAGRNRLDNPVIQGAVYNARDITQRRDAEEQLREALEDREKLAGIVEATSDFVAMADPQGQVLYYNKAARRMLGLGEHENISGIHIPDTHPAWANEIVLNQGLPAAARDGIWQGETALLSRDGREIPVLQVIMAHHAADGTVDYFPTIARDITERRHAEAQLREVLEDRQKLAGIVEATSDFVAMADPQGRVLYYNKAARRMLGIGEHEDISGIRVFDTRPAWVNELIRREGLPAAARDGVWQGETALLGRDGREIPVLQVIIAHYAADGTADYFSTIARDITERRHAEQQLVLAAKVFETNTEGIIVTDAQRRILSVNRAFSAITGYSAEEAIGNTPKMLSSGRQDAAFYQGMWNDINTLGYWKGELWNRHKNGEIYPQWTSITAIHDGNGNLTHYVAVSSDASERKATEERIRYLAHHDFLTDLPNRVLLHDRIRQAIAYAEREGKHTAVMFLDLDRFKNVNDSLGHAVGDELLKMVAARLKEGVRDTDTVSRLGGDEFVILLPSIDDAKAAGRVARKLLTAISRPYQIGPHELRTSSSIGISLFPEDGGDADTLLRNADAAMYSAKEGGRDKFQFFTLGMNVSALERLSLENSLRRALEKKEFLLLYQPQMEIESGRIVGCEALIRWQHPDLGLVTPEKFIPMAEETGLIVPIGDWVLRSACAQAGEWNAAGFGMPVAVNISALQFRQPTFLDNLGKLLHETALPVTLLELELTESIIMYDTDDTLKLVQRLRELGLRLSIDDFGVGYSSLSYLRRFPIHKLKIDQSFIHDLSASPDAAAIAKAIIGLAKNLKLRVIAEGVETAEQFAFLRAHGCDEIQGYYLSHPMDAESFTEFVRGQRPGLSATA